VSLTDLQLAATCPAALMHVASRKALWVPRHISFLNEKLLDVADGTCKRLIVTMPPRSGKSSLVSHYFPAWYLGTHPDNEILLVSYASDFASSWGRKARDVLEEYGPSIFDVSVSQTTRASDEWTIKGRRGIMRTGGVGAGLAGKGSHLLIVDDPVKNAEEAHSETHREKAWDGFISDAMTRLNKDASVVVLMTRWHEDDLGGRILKELAYEGWEYLRLPAIAEEGDALGRRPGEALWPEMFPLPVLETIRRRSSYWWAALYQGRPAPAEGACFKREWIRRWTQGAKTGTYDSGGEVSNFEDLYRFATVDFASSLAKKADYTVVATFGLTRGGKLLLLDVVRRHMEGPVIMQAIRDAWKTHRLHAIYAETTILGLQTAFVQLLRQSGLPIRGFRADKSKELRAMAAQPFCEAGKLYFPERAPWLADFEHEWLSFPHAAHDDQLDAVVMGCIAAQGNRVHPTRAPEPKVHPYSFKELWERAMKQYDKRTGTIVCS
jgi:predicted phage terminase large subunit-like protein